MKTKIVFFCLCLTIAMFFLMPQRSVAQTVTADGKTIFTDEKCSRCHSISILEIKSTGQKVMSDLSNVGSLYTKEFLVKYLNREETIKGKKHLKNLKSEGADVETLSKWLSTLKGSDR